MQETRYSKVFGMWLTRVCINYSHDDFVSEFSVGPDTYTNLLVLCLDVNITNIFDKVINPKIHKITPLPQLGRSHYFVTDEKYNMLKYGNWGVPYNYISVFQPHLSGYTGIQDIDQFKAILAEGAIGDLEENH